jgi:hypothetical protein
VGSLLKQKRTKTKKMRKSSTVLTVKGLIDYSFFPRRDLPTLLARMKWLTGSKRIPEVSWLAALPLRAFLHFESSGNP